RLSPVLALFALQRIVHLFEQRRVGQPHAIERRRVIAAGLGLFGLHQFLHLARAFLRVGQSRSAFPRAEDRRGFQSRLLGFQRRAIRVPIVGQLRGPLFTLGRNQTPILDREVQRHLVALRNGVLQFRFGFAVLALFVFEPGRHRR